MTFSGILPVRSRHTGALPHAEVHLRGLEGWWRTGKAGSAMPSAPLRRISRLYDCESDRS